MRIITVYGLGYVGLSNSMFLSKENIVYGVDINKNIIETLLKKESHIEEALISEYLKKNTNFYPSLKGDSAKYSDFIVIAVSTNLNEENGEYDLSEIRTILKNLLFMKVKVPIIIKSTLGIGDTDKLLHEFPTLEIIYSPEFLQEGNALYGCLNPERVIFSKKTSEINEFINIIKKCMNSDNRCEIFFTETQEAEAIKLFSNAYLAMRISFFNELDILSETLNLNTTSIIKGVCCDGRIGDYYNNPSFGYGGYCLPKDVKVLQKILQRSPTPLIKSISQSNECRKLYISEKISNTKKIGIYLLGMKYKSDNFRNAAIIDIIKKAKIENKHIYIYDPNLKADVFLGYPVLKNLSEFKNTCEIIFANRISPEIYDIRKKVYTRDIFMRN